jgi:hypothetical protein
MPSLIIAGPHIVCYINGRVYGQVSHAEWNSDTPKKPIHGIDSVHPFELAPTTSAVKGSLALYRITGSGGLQGAGVIAPFPDLSREKYFTLQLIDRRSGGVVFDCRQCSPESERWVISTKALMTGTLNFSGISWNNETASK